MRTVFFVSRNKDNKFIPNFKERKKVCLKDIKGFYPGEYEIDDQQLNLEFMKFVNEGAPGELSRIYISVNERDMKETKKDLIVELVKNDDFNLQRIKDIVVSVASKPKNALTHAWLFDFDSKDEDMLNKFISEVEKYTEVLHKTETINGYAVIAEHGFDTRELLKKYPFVELKRDGMLLYAWSRKGFKNQIYKHE